MRNEWHLSSWKIIREKRRHSTIDCNVIFRWDNLWDQAMGKNGGFLTPKAISNRIKAKGLQKLRWYCQSCQKQCRDEVRFNFRKMFDSFSSTDRWSNGIQWELNSILIFFRIDFYRMDLNVISRVNPIIDNYSSSEKIPANSSPIILSKSIACRSMNIVLDCFSSNI